MPFAPQGLEKLGEWRKRIGNLQLVGIGGLSVERGIDVLKAGANCAAAVTDITLNANPEERAREWVAATREFVK
jgi:thiamine-phosphate pyrophosphorylase